MNQEISSDERVIVGEVVGAFGIKGEVKLTALLESPQTLAKVPSVEVRLPDGSRMERRVVSVRMHQGATLVAFEGMDRTGAEGLHGAGVYLRRSEFPPLGPDAWYEWQLLGLSVVTESGVDLGKIERVLYLPANDVYETEVALIPAIAGVVASVDLESARMVVKDVSGLRKDDL